MAFYIAGTASNFISLIGQDYSSQTVGAPAPRAYLYKQLTDSQILCATKLWQNRTWTACRGLRYVVDILGGVLQG